MDTHAIDDATTWKRMRIAIGALVCLTGVLILAVSIIT